MKKVLLKGDALFVDTVIQENRVRVGRGQLEFVPADDMPEDITTTELTQLRADYLDTSRDLGQAQATIGTQTERIASLEDEVSTKAGRISELEALVESLQGSQGNGGGGGG